MAKAAQPATTVASAAVSETLWAVDYPDGEDRELTLLEIEKELARGAINPTTLVWREGMAEWLELGQVPELRSLSASPKPPPAAQRAKAASAPVLPEPRAKAASAPALPELSATLPQPTLPQAAAPQRPPAPSSPAIDFGLRDALKTPTPAPAPLAKSAPAFATGVDARAPAPPGAFAQPIAALTPQAFPASPRPLAAAPFQPAPAAAPPFGRPSPTPFGAVAPIADVPEWPKKSRTPLIIGAVAVVAVGVLIFILTRSSANEVPPPAPISALPAAAPTTPSAPRAAEPAPATDTGRASEQNPGSSAAMEPPGSTPVATPNAGFAELFASGARSADERHGVTGPTQRFDPKAAKAALASAATQTPQCREKGGPAGKATVVVTFEASGKVSSATVSDPPFAGTSSGACIAAALKRATVPAFSGLPGTVTKIISIQ
jgi:GYF domain 2